MPLPSLPPYIWYRIATYLYPEDLSSLSQINTILNKIATREEHFYFHLPVPETKHKLPSLLYRRQRALFHPAYRFISLQTSSRNTILGTVQEDILLVDITNARLSIFPSGIHVNIQELIGPKGNPHILGQYYAEFSRNTVILPEGHVAFVSGTDTTIITILNVKTGVINRYPIPVSLQVCLRIIDGKSVVAAGSDAQYLMFRPHPFAHLLFPWKRPWKIPTTDGMLPRHRISKNMAYMMCECPSINGMSVVGITTEEPCIGDASRKIVVGKGIDNTQHNIKVDRDAEVVTMLRTEDEQTVVVIISNGPPERKVSKFVGYRDIDGVQKSYSSSLPMETRPEFQEDGQVLVARCQPLWQSRENEPSMTEGSRVQFSTVLCDDGSIKSTEMCIDGACPIWFRGTSQGSLVLVAGKYEHWIELRRFQEDGKNWEVLKNWYIPHMHDIRMVDDHFLFATCTDGKNHILHFNRFCKHGGVDGCPLLALNC